MLGITQHGEIGNIAGAQHCWICIHPSTTIIFYTNVFCHHRCLLCSSEALCCGCSSLRRRPAQTCSSEALCCGCSSLRRRPAQTCNSEALCCGCSSLRRRPAQTCSSEALCCGCSSLRRCPAQTCNSEALCCGCSSLRSHVIVRCYVMDAHHQADV